MSLLLRARSLWARIGGGTWDAAFVALSLLVSFAYLSLVPHDTAGQIAIMVFGGIGSIALWWRRRAPIAIVIIGLVVVLVCRVPAPLGIGLFTLAVLRRDRVLALMTLAAGAAFGFDAGVDSGASWVDQAISGALVSGFFVAAGAYVGARADLLTSLRDRADRAEAERELRADQARVAERTRIAQEMHDVLAHKVSLIALHAGALEVNSTAPPERVQQSAELIRTTAREAMEDLREVLGVLRCGAAVDGGELAPQPRAADIERIVEASRAAGVRVDLIIDPTIDVDELPDGVARTAYRIVQEGLTNVHKHARGAATAVTLFGDRHLGVTVEVINQRPVSATTLLPGSGAGLVGLRERIALIGGTMQCGPDTGAGGTDGGTVGGWRLTAWLPWETV